MTLVDRYGHEITADRMISGYGRGVLTFSDGHPDDEPDWGFTYRLGLLSEHTDQFVAAGGRVIVGSLRTYAVVPSGTVYPVVCSEIVPIDTEDGPSDGRCGLDALVEGQCEGHAAEYRAWLATSEAERAQWERDLIDA